MNKEELVLSSAASAINTKPAKTSAPVTSKQDLLSAWKTFVNEHKLAFESEGKFYLKVEAWNYLFARKGLAPTILEVKTQTSVSTDDNGDESNDFIYVAKAGLIPMTDKIDEDIPIGATSYAACKMGENPYCEDYFSALSMAQTRAVGKLGRTVFGHLAVACGFQATPWEEIKGKK